MIITGLFSVMTAHSDKNLSQNVLQDLNVFFKLLLTEANPLRMFICYLQLFKLVTGIDCFQKKSTEKIEIEERQPYCFHLSVCIGNWPITRLFPEPSGQHHAESAWQHRLSRPHSFVYVILSLSSHWASLPWVLALTCTLARHCSGVALFWHAWPFLYVLSLDILSFCLILFLTFLTSLLVYIAHHHQ